jgi:hypothetical protein
MKSSRLGLAKMSNLNIASFSIYGVGIVTVMMSIFVGNFKNFLIGGVLIFVAFVLQMIYIIKSKD